MEIIYSPSKKEVGHCVICEKEIKKEIEELYGTCADCWNKEHLERQERQQEHYDKRKDGIE